MREHLLVWWTICLYVHNSVTLSFKVQYFKFRWKLGVWIYVWVNQLTSQFTCPLGYCGSRYTTLICSYIYVYVNTCILTLFYKHILFLHVPVLFLFKNISPAGAPDRFAGSLQEHGTSSDDPRKIHGDVAPDVSQNHGTVSSESGG